MGTMGCARLPNQNLLLPPLQSDISIHCLEYVENPKGLLSDTQKRVCPLRGHKRRRRIRTTQISLRFYYSVLSVGEDVK